MPFSLNHSFHVDIAAAVMCMVLICSSWTKYTINRIYPLLQACPKRRQGCSPPKSRSRRGNRAFIVCHAEGWCLCYTTCKLVSGQFSLYIHALFIRSTCFRHVSPQDLASLFVAPLHQGILLKPGCDLAVCRGEGAGHTPFTLGAQPLPPAPQTKEYASPVRGDGRTDRERACERPGLQYRL